MSAPWRLRILLALISCYLFLAFAAPILTDDAGLLVPKPHIWFEDVDQQWLYGCVILIVGWVALGPGMMAIRAPQGLVALGWLTLAWLLWAHDHGEQ